jgi:hypothetical protein
MHATQLRIGGCLMCLVSLSGLTGCGSARPTNFSKAVAAPENPKDVADSQFGDKFLKALSDGSARPEMLSLDFRRRIARPTTEEDRQRGYSALNARIWLDRQAKLSYRVQETQEQPGWAMLRGEATGGARPEAFLLSIRKTGNSSGWEVDWFHRTPVINPEVQGSKFATAQQTCAAARAFLETLLGGSLEMAEASLAQSFKANVASPRPSDKDIGYDPSFLRAKLRNWKGSFVNYSLRQGPDEISFTGELTAPGDKQPFTLKVGRDAETGSWLVTEFTLG